MILVIVHVFVVLVIFFELLLSPTAIDCEVSCAVYHVRYAICACNVKYEFTMCEKKSVIYCV